MSSYPRSLLDGLEEPPINQCLWGNCSKRARTSIQVEFPDGSIRSQPLCYYHRVADWITNTMLKVSDYLKDNYYAWA